MGEAAKYILDIRSEEEFLEGHLPGSVNAQIQELTFVLRDAEPDDKILLVCLTGTRAHRVKAMLAEEGFEQVEVLEGGMKAYKGEIVQGE